MNALSLFSGIGGLDLAAEWAGFKTVAFCECDPFCQKVLAKHWPGVKIYDDVRTIDTSELPRIELLHGGYPCQPFSTAGNRRGESDERHMWPHMLRIVRELNPRWVVGENVKGHITLGLDTVCDDLEGAGYKTRAFVLPACAVGTPHKRERVFIVAHSDSRGWDTQPLLCPSAPEGERAANAYGTSTIERRENPWVVEPDLVRVVHGVPRGLDKVRVKSLGNTVVPQQAYPIFAAIAETYNDEDKRARHRQ